MPISLPSGATTLIPIQLKRQGAAPLDIDSVFVNTNERITYLSNPRRYSGQLCIDLEAGNAYFMNTNRDGWILVGAGGPTGPAGPAGSGTSGPTGPTGAAGANASTAVINTSVSLVADATHVNAIVRFNTSGGPLTFTVTSGSGFTNGDTSVLTQLNANTVTVVAGPGQTVLSPESLSIRKINGKITISKVDTDTWEVEGNLA